MYRRAVEPLDGGRFTEEETDEEEEEEDMDDEFVAARDEEHTELFFRKVSGKLRFQDKVNMA